MGKINYGRVILGGLLAGVVINIGEYVLNVPILGQQWMAAMESLNRSSTDANIIWYFVWGFGAGLALIWLYAAIRPRFGAGPKTAIVAGIGAWFFLYLWGFGSTVISGIFPNKLVLIVVIWALFEMCIAGVIGAWLYKEEAAD